MCLALINQVASQKTLGSLLLKTWQIRMIGTAGEEVQGVQVYVCIAVSVEQERS